MFLRQKGDEAYDNRYATGIYSFYIWEEKK